MSRLYEKRKQREGRPSVTDMEESNTQLGQNDPVPLHTIDEESVTIGNLSLSKLVLPFIHG